MPLENSKCYRFKKLFQKSKFCFTFNENPYRRHTYMEINDTKYYSIIKKFDIYNTSEEHWEILKDNPTL